MKIKLENGDKIYDIKVSSAFYNGKGDSLIFEFINPLCNDRLVPVSFSQLDDKDKIRLLSTENIVQKIKDAFKDNLDPSKKSKSKIKAVQAAYNDFYNSLSDELKLLYELN